MIWKLLRRNISFWQIAGYSTATLVGLAIVLVAVQFYRDASDALAADENGGIGLISSRNIVISKPVGLTSTLSGTAPTFSSDDIAEIESQGWAGKVSPFQAADFNVSAGIDFGGRSMRTAMFLESLPDEVIDVDDELWEFDPENPSVPIIISKDYLTLYNLGFAASGRMPLVTEGMLSKVPLTITLSGNGQKMSIPGRIVNYSNWLNTVAVPQAFMEWAHERFGQSEVSEPSRLVVEVSDPSDPNITKFLEERDYEQAGRDNDLGRATYFLKLLTTVIVAVGFVITLLALGILMLSLFLLVQKNRRAISGLLLLGYSPGQISACYIRLVTIVNFVVAVLACAILFAVSPLWQGALSEIDVSGASIWMAVALGFCIMGIITLINICVISRLVRKVFLLN